jgi:hypothetical protein
MKNRTNFKSEISCERRKGMRKVLAALALAAIAAIAIAASQVDSRSFRTVDGFYEVCATLTSDASGDATLSISNLNGKLYRLSTSPASAASSPTANWDLTLVDDNTSFSVDLLQGAGANRSQSATQAYLYDIPSVLVGDYTLTGANMGNAKTAYIQLVLGK